jgi:hypothetical protein
VEKRQDNCGICWNNEKLCFICHDDGSCTYDPFAC